ncbi:MAG TPA: glycosyltransferase family 4 protein [Candidatus Didemnitutus sp.]|nr:glycosyltransferase family 4 protein [Candidatus Didemnitutus sp.]
MPETAFSLSHLDAPVDGAILPEGRHRLLGWVWPKGTAQFVDVRARIAHRTFAATHGFPRADLAVHFRTGKPYALAGFDVVVELARGPAEIDLETLDLDGTWRVFQTVRFDVRPASPPAHVATPVGELRWHEFGRALQALLRESRRNPDASLDSLADEIVREIPHPRYLLHPPFPFHGHLDEPAALTHSQFGRVPVFGYLFHETEPILRVLATFDLQILQAIAHYVPSPNPAAHFAAFPQAARCGLHGFVDVPSQLPRPTTLRLYAETVGGGLVLCSALRSRLTTQEDNKAPYAGKDRVTFDSALAFLRSALQSAGIAVAEDDEMRQELARLRLDHEKRAPIITKPVSPARPAPLTLERPLPRTVLLATHNLNLEGAPLFLFDYARFLSEQGVRLRVVSPTDGPLRDRFAGLGAEISLVDLAGLFSARSREDALAAVDRAAAQIRPETADLVVANTFTTFWAVHAAQRAGRPALMYVHESTTPASFYGDRVHPEMVALATEAFGIANAVSFTTESTRRYHLDYGDPTRHRLTPGWVDLARIDAWRKTHPRLAERTHFGLGPDDLLVSNIGTVCDRKGQHIFAQAVDLLMRHHPGLGQRTRFVMLGGRHTIFDEQLREILGQLGRENLVVHPETPDYLPYFVAADLFVCSSFEESSPRVILEAMACGAPIVSSGVHGILEQVRPEQEAILVPPGDPVALAGAMARALAEADLRTSLARRARKRAEEQFAAATVLPRHAALAAEIARPLPPP